MKGKTFKEELRLQLTNSPIWFHIVFFGIYIMVFSVIGSAASTFPCDPAINVILKAVYTGLFTGAGFIVMAAIIIPVGMRTSKNLEENKGKTYTEIYRENLGKRPLYASFLMFVIITTSAALMGAMMGRLACGRPFPPMQDSFINALIFCAGFHGVLTPLGFLLSFGAKKWADTWS